MGVQTKGTLKTYFETGDKPTQQQFWDFIQSQPGVIGSVTGFNLNSASNQPITLSGGTKFLITNILLLNPSKETTNFDAVGFWNNATHDDYKIANFNSTFNNADFANTIASIESGVQMNPDTTPGKLVGTTIYGQVNTPEGSACTCDVVIIGIPML